MPTYDVRSVEVEFPFQAYDCQLVYMEKVITSLQSRKNALLESPTGTGKTLCLLCATLAWQKSVKAKAQLDSFTPSAEQLSFDGPQVTGLGQLASRLERAAGALGRDGSQVHVPKILYASRTHTQLSQTIKELKATSYKPSICTLASREQLCIHHEVSALESNAAKTAVCRQKVNERSCGHLQRLEATKNERPPGELGIMDIEDLVSHGQKTGVCPYYLAREEQETADIIVLPYNYLLDANMRRAQKIPISNNIVIIDEAHNIEKQAEDSASFELTPTVLAGCIDEITKVVGMDPALFDGEGQLKREELVLVKAMLLNLEELLCGIDIGNSAEGKSFPGSFVYELFSQVNLTAETCHLVSDVLNRTVSILAADKSTRGRSYLTTFVEMLGVVFVSSDTPERNEAIAKHYKVHIRNMDEKKRQQKKPTWDSNDSTGSALLGKKRRILSFWCFSPGIAIKEFEALGTHAIVLTSGTLSPLDSFAAELMVNFPVVLENPHVIDSKQAWVGIVPRGPANCELSSSYQHRSRPEYKRDLGNTIVNFARIVPKGVLVFFPSYFLMKDCIAEWQTPNGGRSIWDRITQFKHPVVEPQSKSEFVGAMHDFYEKIKDTASNGAIFFAVCRGKVSEGLDFANDNGRAVIITGMPYPPYKDPKVALKREHCDAMVRSKNSTLGGGDWYQQQSTRAVNQAIGRVIRHRHDFGAIIFCDARFAQQKNIAQMPLWVRPNVTICNSFGESQRSLSMFFKSMSQNASQYPHISASQPEAKTGPTRIDNMQVKEAVRLSNLKVHSDPADVVMQSSTPANSNIVSLTGTPKPPNLLTALREHGRPVVTSGPKKSQREIPCVASDSLAKATDAANAPHRIPTHMTNFMGNEQKVAEKASRMYAAAMDQPKHDGSDKLKNMPGEIQTHVTKIKNTLTKDEFRRFTTLLKTFKSDLATKQVTPRRAMITLVLGLKRLFVPYGRVTGADLLDNFRNMLPRDKQKLFKEAILKLKSSKEASMLRRQPLAKRHDSDGITIDRKRKLHEDFQGRSTVQIPRLPGIALAAEKQDNETSHDAVSTTQTTVKGATSNTDEFRMEQTNMEKAIHNSDCGGTDSHKVHGPTDTQTDDHLVKGGHTERDPSGKNMCPLCSRKLQTPFEGPCGCRCCFNCWMKGLANEKVCPVSGCGQPVRKKQLRKVFFL